MCGGSNEGLVEVCRGYGGVNEGDVSGCASTSTDFCLGVNE